MLIVESGAGDYCRAKADLVLGRADSDDIIVSADSHSFITFLSYHTEAKVLDAKFVPLKRFMDEAKSCKGKIFIFGDVIEPLPSVEGYPYMDSYNSPSFAERLEHLDKGEGFLLYLWEQAEGAKSADFGDVRVESKP